MGKNLVEIIVTAEDKASGALKGIGGALGNVGRIATGAALSGVAVLAGGFALAGRSAIQMNAQLESSTLQFETLMGDADRAKEHVDGLFDFAAKTPFETGPIIEASRVMQVFGGDALNTDENLTRIGDTAAAVGAPIEDIGFWVGRAYAAIQGGQPFGEAAQNLMQMGAVSPQVIAEMNRLKETGASNDEIFAVLTGHFDQFGGAMEKQSQTWSGLMATLSDSLQMAAAEGFKPFFDIAKRGLDWLVGSGIIERVTTVVQGITGAFANFFANITSGQSLANSLVWAFNTLGHALGLSQEQIGQISIVLYRVGEQFTALKDRFVEFITPIWNSITGFVSFKDVLIALGAVLGGTLLVAIGSLIAGMAPILLTIGAIVAVVALLRNAWENNWGGIQEKVAAVWAAIQPPLQMVWDWLKVKIPEGLEQLRAFWVDTAWPAIQAAIEWVWPIISAIFSTLINVIQTAIIPTVRNLYEFWVNTAMPAIRDALLAAWNDVIKPVLDALKTFIIETLMPAIRDLATKWSDEWWPMIKQAVKDAWDFIQPIWESIKVFALETIPKAISSMRDKFDEVMGAIRAAIEPVKQAWEGFVGAVQGFWDWIKGRVFEFQISLPDLPTWATPGSPLPIHTAWKAFAGDMNKIGGQLSAGFDVGLGAVGATGAAATRPVATGGGTHNVTVNIDARGAARGVDTDLRRMVEDVMREYGGRADVRMRTGY